MYVYIYIRVVCFLSDTVWIVRNIGIRGCGVGVVREGFLEVVFFERLFLI